MLFDCVLDCRDNGTKDTLTKWGFPVTHNYRRGTRYDLPPKEIAVLFDRLTGLDDDALHGWPTERDSRGRGGEPTRDVEYIPVIGFLECFRPADDFATKWLDDHNDELVDIVDAKVEYLKGHPVPVGTVDPGRRTLARKGTKSVAQTLADGVPTATSTLAGAEDRPPARLRPKRQLPAPKAARKPMSDEARKAAGERLKAAREKKAAMAAAGA